MTEAQPDFASKFLGGRPFLSTCSIANNGVSLTTQDALIDTGANGYLFVSVSFAKRLLRQLRLEEYDGFRPRPVGGFDGSASQLIDIAIRGHLTVQNRTIRDEWFLVIDSKHDLIVGRKWLDYHDVFTDCRRRRLLFPTEHLPDPSCWKQANISLDGAPRPSKPNPAVLEDIARREKLMEMEDQRRRDGRMVAQRIAELEEQERRRPAAPRSRTPPPKRPRISHILSRHEATPEKARFADEAKMDRALQGDQSKAPSPPPPRQGKELEDDCKRGTDQYGRFVLKRDAIGWYKERPPDISAIGAVALKHLARSSPAGVTSIAEIDRLIEDRVAKSMPRDADELHRKAASVIPDEYHGFLGVFSKAESDDLPPHRPQVDHKIELTANAEPEDLGYSSLYKLSLEELEAARKYITENLHKGFIEPSDSPWAAPVLFAVKPNGGLRFCVDYRKLNAVTKKDRYPLPLIDETLARISQAKIFTKIDIRQAFHRIRIKPDHEELTTFRTRYGAYKYKVMPFGLTNGPSTFQRFINNTLMGYLDDFCSAYIDDILIFSDNLHEHKEHVRKVLERLREAGLQADVDKCEFHVTSTKFLGFIIGTEGIAVDPSKIAAVRDWAVPTTVKGVQSFLGFCNFYRRFVREYGRTTRPLTALTKKDAPFDWNADCQRAFEDLKDRLLNAPVLAHFSHEKPTRVETDASQGVVAGVLTQQQSNGGWHPVAFYSETMQGAEHNYHIHDKELLAVVRALQCWRAELIGLQAEVPFLVITDHEALKYFSTKRLLNARQAGWAELLAQYHFQITYRPGKENAAADALSRKTEDTVTQKAKREVYRTMQVFAPVVEDDVHHDPELGDFVMALDEDVSPPDGSGFELVDELLRHNQSSPELELYREKARNEPDSDYSLLDGRLLLQNGRLVVPAVNHLRTRVITEAHSRLTTAHPGRNKTRLLINARYWWPRMGSDIDQYIANCACRAAKHPRDKTPGLLQPIPPPQWAWQSIVMDFNEFPKDKYGFDNALVIIDRLTKASWTIPCTKEATARTAAKLYYEGPYRVHGLPQEVISDRGPQFRADFTDELSKILGITWKLATPGHSQTAGQVENLNAYINQRLRPFVSHYQDNWSTAMPALDAVQASLPHDSTGLQPHEVMFGFPMPLPFDWEARSGLKGMPRDERLSREDAQQSARKIQGFVDFARANILKAQEKQAEQANRHRRAPDFDVDDYVVILKRTEMTSRPSDKLDFPVTQQRFRIIEKVGHAFRLKVPSSWKGTDLFTPDRLRRHPNNPLPGQEAENPRGEEVEPTRGEEYEVEKLLASRTHYGKLQYQVQWKGWDPDPEWYYAENFKNSPVALKRFHDDNPERAGPPARLQLWLEMAENDEFAPSHPGDNTPVAAGTKLRRSTKREKG